MTPNDRLKNEIDKQGRKYSWIAEMACVPTSTLSEILNNKRKMTANEVVKFCNILSIPASTIVPTKFDKCEIMDPTPNEELFKNEPGSGCENG